MIKDIALLQWSASIYSFFISGAPIIGQLIIIIGNFISCEGIHFFYMILKKLDKIRWIHERYWFFYMTLTYTKKNCEFSSLMTFSKRSFFIYHNGLFHFFFIIEKRSYKRFFQCEEIIIFLNIFQSKVLFFFLPKKDK